MKKLIVLFVSIVFSCTSYSEISIKNSLFSEKEKPKSLIDSSTFRLSLGETHLKLFNIQQKEYSGDLEINLLFERFNIEQKNLCEMIYGTKTKKNYIYSKFLKINSELPENKWLSKIITGCWNYYSMNDIGVENDFLLVRELYPDHEMDCYSVGFMQPYIMQGVLNCKRLIFLDIDWKILESHFWIFRDFALGLNDSGLTWERYKETINWDIGIDMIPRKRKEDLGYETICANNQSSMCKKAIEKMVENKPGLEEVRLNLGFLHEGHYNFEPGRVAVVYTSNALDPAYTSKRDFKKFLKLLGKGMHESNKMLMIYHAGGRRAFGVYEIIRINNYLKINAVCRDNYTLGSIYKDAGKTYKIYLDDYTKHQKSIPSCGYTLNKLNPIW